MAGILRFASAPGGLDWLLAMTESPDPDSTEEVREKVKALYKYLRWGYAYAKANPFSRERKVSWHFMMKYHADAYGREMTREEELGYEAAKKALQESNAEIKRRKQKD